MSSLDSTEQRVDVPDALQPLSEFLSQREDRAVQVIACKRLTGGAIQENWLLTAMVSNGPFLGEERWILRTDAPSVVAASMGRAQEFAVLRAVHRAGVKVPEPLWLCSSPEVIGRDFFIMEALEGTANGRLLSSDPALDPRRPTLCRELGESLARLHCIEPGHPELDFIPAADADPIRVNVDQYRRYLDALPGSYPVIEWGLRWCELHRPAAMPARLIHRDYRTGNYMVNRGFLAGVLDWEFAAWGDPREDLGWFTARCWRFTRPDRVAGGVGELDDFLDGYHGLSGFRPDAEELRFWQMMAHLRWALVALQQAQRHLTGQQRSLELALTGRMVPELEHEILVLGGGQR